jgi:opacity protein-like surface antigen
MKMRLVIIPALLLTALVSAPAGAQTTLTPFTGVTFGGDTTENKFVYGAVLGFGGNAGLDIDLGYAPNFFGNDDPFGDLDGKLNITTLMFNIRFGGGKQSGASPFVSGGAGLMRASVTSPGNLFDSVTRNDFALNVGGGINAYFNDHVGLRGDIRYFRSLQGEAGADGVIIDPRDFDLGDFSFMRATVGLNLRF